ncbi:MAG: hypothetical protein ACLSVG_09500 [Clostridia bacterium]
MKKTATEQNKIFKISFFVASLLNNKKAEQKILKELFYKNPEMPDEIKSFYIKALQLCNTFFEPQKRSELPAEPETEEKSKSAENMAFAADETAAEPPEPAALKELMQVISALPCLLRAVFLSCYYAELSDTEIAEAISVSEETIQNALKIAVRLFRKNAEKILNRPVHTRELIQLLPVVFQEAEKSAQNFVKNRKRIRIVVVSAAALVIAALILSAIFYFPWQKEQNREPMLAVTAEPTVAISPTASHTRKSTPLPTVTPSATPTSTPKPTPMPQQLPQWIVLSRLTYADGKTIHYEYKDTTVTGKDEAGNIILTLEFDSEGNLLRRTEHNTVFGKNQDRIRVWDFDKNGNIIRICNYGIGPMTEETYRYDSAGKQIAAASNYGSVAISTFKYDDNGKPIRQTATHPDGSISEYTYDQDGKITEEKFYNAIAGTLSYEIAYEYGEKGKIRKATQRYYDASGKTPESIRTEEYDGNGNTLNSRFQYEAGKPVHTDYEYDETGKWIRQERVIETDHYKQYQIQLGDAEHEYTFFFDRDAQIFPKFVYEKNKEGYYIIKDDSYDWELGIRYTDEYNSAGNLIKRTYYDEYDQTDNYYSCDYDAQNRKIEEFHYESECCGDEFYYFHYYYEYDAAGTISHIIDEARGDEYWFDTAGHLTQYTSRSTENNSIKIKYSYHENGKISEKVLEFTEKDAPLSVQYKYDEAGNSLGNTYRIGNTISNFNAQGQKIKEITYSEKDAVLSTRTFLYSPIGKISEITEYTAEQSVASRTEFQYDQTGGLLGWTKYDAEKNVLFKYQNTLNINSLPGNDGNTLQGEAEYDHSGNLIHLASYDGTGKQIQGVFQGTTKESYNLYLKCNITYLIPTAW